MGGWGEASIHSQPLYSTVTTDFLFMGTHYGRMIGIQKDWHQLDSLTGGHK